MDTPKLYIGNLSYSVTDQQLKDKFADAGTVIEATVIMNKYTGRSKGFGFVTMSSADEAKKAIEMFHEQDFEGRKMIVSEARPKREDDTKPAGAPAEKVLKEGEPTAVEEPTEAEPTVVEEPVKMEEEEPTEDSPKKEEEEKTE